MMAGTIEQDAPRARLAALLQHFFDLDDSREPWRVMYPLKDAAAGDLRDDRVL